MVNFPVFVHAKDSGEVAKFDSVHDLQRAIERIDVENGEYDIWDSHGDPLEMTVQEPLWLVLVPSGEHSGITLCSALAKYATALGIDLTSVSGQAPLAVYEHIRRHAKPSGWGS